MTQLSEYLYKITPTRMDMILLGPTAASKAYEPEASVATALEKVGSFWET